MDEMVPFLQAVAANPDDNNPRLELADWLEAQGHHAHAEFIRLQIELAEMDRGEDGYAEKTATMRRCGVLTGKRKFRFFDHLPTRKCRIAFNRGFIELIDTNFSGRIDGSGFDCIPLQSVRTGGNLLKKFQPFKNLKQLEYRETSPAKLLEIFGPDGWFPNLEELRLSHASTACLESGVIPQFDLPRLRNFFINTPAFYDLGVPVPDGPDENDDDFYTGKRPWGGLPDYLPHNALPNSKSPLERFVWHSKDDDDFFNEEHWYWRGPVMESLLEHLKGHDLKQIEVVVDYDDHENGAEGVIAAPWRENPLALSSTLEAVTFDDYDLQRLKDSPRKLKSLRIYGYDVHKSLFTLLHQPVCSELESLHIEARGGYWGEEPEGVPAIAFPKLKSLWLSSAPLGYFSNCEFPELISLPGFQNLETILKMKWAKLQSLRVNVRYDSNDFSDLKTFAQSDCCPNLTTLTIEGYFDPEKVNFSFLANCPYMPHLSLLRVPNSSKQTYVIDNGKLIPVREDIIMDDQLPTPSFRIPVAF